MQLVLLIQGLPVKLSFSLVLQNEFVVFGLLIYKHQQNGFWLLAVQKYQATSWAIRRWTVGATTVSGHPRSSWQLRVRRLVTMCSFSFVLVRSVIKISAVLDDPWTRLWNLNMAKTEVALGLTWTSKRLQYVCNLHFLVGEVARSSLLQR